jgi:hypothetical protein
MEARSLAPLPLLPWLPVPYSAVVEAPWPWLDVDDPLFPIMERQLPRVGVEAVPVPVVGAAEGLETFAELAWLLPEVGGASRDCTNQVGSCWAEV